MENNVLHDLMLENFRAIRGDISRLHDDMSDVKQRLSRIEISMIGLRQDRELDRENMAHMQVQLDRVNTRVDRIETRLDISD